MDQQAAIAALEWWVETASSARETTSSYGHTEVHAYARKESAAIVALKGREHLTRSVLAHVLGTKDLPVILVTHETYTWLGDGIDLCTYALGKLRTEAEARAILGPAAPSMAADSLHPTVWEAASALWEDGHFRAAVQKAATRVNAEVQFKTGRYDESDVALMQQAFSSSPPARSKPRLRWPGSDDDLTVRAMRTGLLNFAQGVFSAIRNPATHSTTEMPRQEAFEQLAALSLLARWIDACELVEME